MKTITTSAQEIQAAQAAVRQSSAQSLADLAEQRRKLAESQALVEELRGERECWQALRAEGKWL